MLSTLVGLALFVAMAAGGAWIQARRTRRLLGSDPPAPPPPAPLPRPAEAPSPEVAQRLLAIGTPVDPEPALVRDPTLDRFVLVEQLREDFERLIRGEEPETVLVGPAVADAPNVRGAMLDLATRPPRLMNAFADDRWMSVHAAFEALVQVEGPLPRRWSERWALRRARGTERWELAQIVDGQLRPLGEPPPSGAANSRYLPMPAGAPLPVEPLLPAFAQALAVLRGESPPTPDLHPAFVAELRFRAELVAASKGAPPPADARLTLAREGTRTREGALTLRSVWVEGESAEGRFRERWVLTGGEDTWVLAAAEDR